MTILILGLAALLGAHLIAPMLRRMIGEKATPAAIGVISLLGTIAIVFGYRSAEFVEVYEPLPFAAAKHLAYSLMLLAFILIVASLTPNNIKRFVPHPMATGFFLWTVAHLAANGDLASVVMFGVLGLYCLYVMVFGARSAKPAQPITKDLVVVVIGAVAFGATLYLHGAVGGVYLIG